MASTTIVNKMTTQHKASMGVTTAFPDVCKTPAPPAPSPVPIPYPNVGMSGMASVKTSKKVKDNKQKVVVKGSAYSLSNGDQPGVAMGVVSNKIMGKSCIKNQSFNVKFEGKGVGRLMDPHGNNSGSKPNAIAPMEGQPPNIALGGQAAIARKAACERLKKCHVPENQQNDTAITCGMDPKHAKGIRQSCKDSGRSVTFRSTNKKSRRHINNNLPAKGCDVKEKSISKKTRGMATEEHQKQIKDNGLEGLVGAYEEDLIKDANGEIQIVDRLVGVKTTDGHIPFDELSGCPPPPDNVYTGDYDAHDMFDTGGGRIMDGTTEESDFTRELNQAIGRGMGDENEMVRHGPQANYPEYATRTANYPEWDGRRNDNHRSPVFYCPM